jgi:hypothetical protein
MLMDIANANEVTRHGVDMHIVHSSCAQMHDLLFHWDLFTKHKLKDKTIKNLNMAIAEHVVGGVAS